MKVGILSMQRIANYGSFLQAFALKQIIEAMDAKVEFVDYHVKPPLIQETAGSNNKYFRKINKGIEVFRYHAPILHKINYIRHKQSFGNEYMSLLGIAKHFNYLPKLDCLVIGSDEVFNCIQKNSNVGYSLELFGENNKADRLISYAASFGNTTLDKLEQYGKSREIANLLGKFNALSVRDESSGIIIKTLIGEEPKYHLDPVLIYDFMHADNLIPDIPNTERYLVLYAYSGRITEDEAKWIATYAKSKDLKIYAIGGIQKCADRFVNCGPFEVLAYFKNAEEVITDTFHGSIFSIITRRKFVTLIRKSIGDVYGNEEKLFDLFTRLKLKGRSASSINEVAKINDKNIDYTKVEDIINKNREMTKSYLKEQLEAATLI